MTHQEYMNYLNSPEWKECSRRVKEIWNYRCALDSAHTGPIEVHHRTYDPLGHEELYDVIPLCRSCHKKLKDCLPRYLDREQLELVFMARIPGREEMN